MKLLRPQTRVDNDDALGIAIEFAVIMGVFFLAGWGLDRWLGTVPVFMIVFSVLAAVGLFAKSKYRYEEKMQALEAERRTAGSRIVVNPTPETTVAGEPDRDIA
jgi:F0F1-type ATP synthase assembly protein I